jgi:1-acyl-sn-glycerol-3-phosphate acyltransferase
MEPPSRFRTLRALAHLLFLRPLLKIFFGANVEGRENLEGLDQFILVANHNSHLDTALLFHSLPVGQLSRTHPVAALDYFGKSPVLFSVARFFFQPIWITRGDRETNPMEGMRQRLREGHSVIIFPEGTRGEPGELAPFRTGIGRLAVDFPHVPIVPVLLVGADRALPKSSGVPLPVWTRVVVGMPQLFKGSARETTRILQGMVEELARVEQPGRHERIRGRLEVPTLAVLGIDGSGKSTLSRILAQRLSEGRRVCLVTDDVAFFEDGVRQEIYTLVTERLREAIGRRAKTAGSLKSYKVPKLAELFLRDQMVGHLRRWYRPDLIVMDGCPLLNVTAWARLYREEPPDDAVLSSAMGILSGSEEGGPTSPAYAAFPDLAKMKKLPLPNLKRPDAVLFLDVDPSVSVERISKRGESRQVHETGEKLGRLREGYRAVCRILEANWDTPARILDGHGDLDEVTGAALTALVEMGVIGESPSTSQGKGN